MSSDGKASKQGPAAEDGAPPPALLLAVPTVIDEVMATLVAATAAAVEAAPSLRGREADIHSSALATLLARHAAGCALDVSSATGFAPAPVLEFWLQDRLMRIARHARMALATQQSTARQADIPSEAATDAVH